MPDLTPTLPPSLAPQAIKDRLKELSEGGDLNNFDSLMARVRAAQALSALEDDNHKHYKETVLKSIDDVLAKFEFANAPAVEQWSRDYKMLQEKAAGSIDEVHPRTQTSGTPPKSSPLRAS